MPTISGSVGGQNVFAVVATQALANLGQGIVNYAGTTNYAGSGSTAGSYYTANNTSPATLTGSSTFSLGVLAGKGDTFQTGASLASLIIAGDGTNTNVINNNAYGSIIAVTGQGTNTLQGGGAINAFQTSAGGVDQVTFATQPNGPANQANSLISGGQDTVTIFGPGAGVTQSNTIQTIDAGRDVINVNGATLTFLNTSSQASAILATGGSTVNVGGTGATSVTAAAGTGAVTFNVNTASGNVTLTGSSNAADADAFNFAKLQAGAGTARDVVSNFTANDTVRLTGYGAAPYTAQVVGGSTVVTLSDNSTITFSGISNSSLVTSKITVG